MQITDMKSLRSFYFNRQLLISAKPKSFSHPFRLSLLNPHFYCSSQPDFSTQSSNSQPSNGNDRRVWSIYNLSPGQKHATPSSLPSSGDGSDDPANQRTGLRGRSENSEGEAVDARGESEKFSTSKKGGLIGGGIKRKGKSKVSWVCSDCGNVDGQWWGYCRACNGVGTMKQFSEVDYGKTNGGIEVLENVGRSWFAQQAGELQPLRLKDVCRGINQKDWRINLPGSFGTEVSRVLGGGLVPGSLVLIGGDPGVGKSTLALQIAAVVAERHEHRQPAPVVYISGEESVEQIGNRAERIGIGTEELFLYSSTDIEDILEKIQPLSPRAIVLDSIQTVYLKGVAGSAGSIYQVKECTSALLRFAKKTNIPVLMIGHVTKTGDIAGPRVLEHIVDVVLYMEGEKNSSHRLLRSVKNRFGSNDELGVFEMLQAGLQAASNPSEMFLTEQQADSEVFAGLAIAVIMDGSRSFLIEVQALSLSGSTVARHARQFNGIQSNRAEMIISVLIKQAGLKIQENDIYLNVVSGIKLTETAGDLAIAAAICSSLLEFPIPSGIAFIGEIGLGGELRTVPQMEKRVNTLAKLGYKKCVVPASAAKSLATAGFDDIQIKGCKNLKEVINSVFAAPQL